MKRTLLPLLLLLLCTSAFAQDWLLDFNKAVAIARKENKPIILVFQGSDWCTPCIRLDREVWETEAFKSYASDHYVMLLADFPRRKQNALPAEQAKANAALADRYNPKGYFPLVVVMDAEGRVLGETGYNKLTPAEYIDHLNSIISGG